MATWAVVKAQARDILGINLTDADVDNVPLLATDAYGNFIKGPNGFPQVVMNAGPTAFRAPTMTCSWKAIRRRRSVCVNAVAHRPRLPDRHRAQRQCRSQPTASVRLDADADVGNAVDDGPSRHLSTTTSCSTRTTSPATAASTRTSA